MQLAGSLARLNKAAAQLAKQGDHAEAAAQYDQLFAQLAAQHVTHPELYIIYSNRATCCLALGLYQEALQDAQQCMKLLSAAAAGNGLANPSHHPYWPKACQRVGHALTGLGQHGQAAAVYEAGLASDPFNNSLKAGLQRAQQGLLQDLLNGKTFNHKALPGPPIPERIMLVPHNASRAALRQAMGQGLGCHGAEGKPLQTIGLGPGQQYSVGWQLPAVEVIRAAAVGELGTDGWQQQQHGAGDSAGNWGLPSLLLTPTTAAADPAIRDVYEYVTTQCNIQVPKRYVHQQLPDAARLHAWWSATTAAVQAVSNSGRHCRVLLLGAKAGLLAVAAVQAGAVHVTCVEQNPYLAATCHQVLLAHGLTLDRFTVISKHPTALKLGHDLPVICNCLIADVVDDGVLSGGFIPAVVYALDELLVRDEPVLVPAALTVMAQAVAVRPSGCKVEGRDVDLSSLDRHRWTPSQALPSPLHPSTLLPLSQPQQAWHMPSLALQMKMSAVTQVDVEITKTAAWSGIAFWAELQLFDGIIISTAGQWQQQQQQHVATAGGCNGTKSKPDGGRSHGRSSDSNTHIDSSSNSIAGDVPSSYQPAICWFEGAVPVQAGEVYPLLACHNSVRMSFTLREADYQYMLAMDPAFPHGHFAAVADQPCLAAYYEALKAAITIAALTKQQPQLAVAAGATDAVNVTVLDAGCGSGVLSLLAAAAAAAVSLPPDAAGAAEGTVDGAAAEGTVSAAAARQGLPGAAEESAAAAAAALETAASAAATVPVGRGAKCPTSASVPVTANVIGAELVAPLAAAAVRNAALNGCSADISIVHADVAMLERGRHVPWPGVDVVVFDMFDSGLIGHQVLGLLEVIKSKLLGENGQLVPACATLYAMGVELTTATTWQRVLAKRQQQQQEQAEHVVGYSVFDGAHGIASMDLSALEQFGWSGGPEAVLLDHLPYQQLTRPVKLFDFDFCAPAGTPYPTESAALLDVIAEGTLNCVAVWFDLHLAPGVSITSAPNGFTIGGRSVQQSSSNSDAGANKEKTSSSSSSDGDSINGAEDSAWQGKQARPATSSYDSIATCLVVDPTQEDTPDCKAIIVVPPCAGLEQQHAVTASTRKRHSSDDDSESKSESKSESESERGYRHRHWGQSLHYLDHTAAVSAGAEVHLEVQRQGPKLTVKFKGGLSPAAGITRTNSTSDTYGMTGSSSGSRNNGASSSTALVLEAAPRPAWLRSGAGIEDPAVWSVKKCQQLLAQMLQRGPGGKFPPIWKDLALMQVHAGSLGLDAAVVGAVSQQLTMQEALAVAAGKQVAVSGLAMAEAAGLQPPLLWH